MIVVLANKVCYKILCVSHQFANIGVNFFESQASEIVRKQYDMKCKILRNLESKAEKTSTVDKTRAAVKDLHSRIRVAIHRIDSISKRIEELRDRELQPQLEELIDGYD